MNDPATPNEPPSLRKLIERYPTRKMKIMRIRTVEKKLGRLEDEDEMNDPILIRGFISMSRGVRFGMGTILICLALICLRETLPPNDRAWAIYLFFALLISGAFAIFRGFMYRPDAQAMQESYVPHRTKPNYRHLVEELEQLSRALSQDMSAEDADPDSNI